MAADVTYPSRPYHHRDGSFRIPSGSTMYVESGGVLNIQSGGGITWGGTETYSGTVSISGTWTNTGTITNEGTIVNTSTFTNTGTFTNDGTIVNTSTFTNTGTITNSGAGKIVDSVANNKTAGATVLPYGVTLVGSSTAGAREYKLPRPGTAGVVKRFISMGSTASGVDIISATATASICKFRRTLTKIKMKTANTRGLCLTLVAATSTDWSIDGYSTAAGTYTCT